MRDFQTGNSDADKILHSLDRSSDDQEMPDRELLQIWLGGVITRIEKLPEPFRSQMNVRVFQIGDEHYTCPDHHVVEISRRLLRELRARLDRLAARSDNPPG